MPDPNQNAYPSPADVTSYEKYTQDHEFVHDLGIEVLPVASRTPKHRVIRLHGGVAMRKVSWVAGRSGKPPVIPIAANLSADRLLQTEVHAGLPVPMPQSGGFMFHMRGTYVYVQQTPRVAGVNALPTGSYPFTLSPLDELASAAIGNVLGHSTQPTTVAEFDAAVTLVDQTVRRGRGTSFVWPITALPASFAAETIS